MLGMPCQDFPCGGSKCVWASSILVIVNEAIGADVGGVLVITGNVFPVAVVGDEPSDDIEFPPEPHACKRVNRLALRSTGEIVFMCAIFDAQATVGEHLATDGRPTQMGGLQ